MSILADFRHRVYMPGCNCPDCYGEGDSEMDVLDAEAYAEDERDDLILEWQEAFEAGEVSA